MSSKTRGAVSRNDINGIAPADSTVHSLLDAYAVEGFEIGYARGSRDVLRLYPGVIEQFLYDHTEVSDEVRRTLRAFSRYVEDHVSRKLDEAGFIEGSGI